MITLITGKPGMGKTSLLVSMLLKIEGTRPIYVMGVPDLKIEHFKCPPFAEWTEKRPDPDDPTIELDYYTFPPDSLIVVDEAQRVFRPRSSGSKVPPQVAAYETHRHTGVDFILLTQSPKLLDANIRELVGKHVHIGERLLGRYLWEWKYVGDPESKVSREEASKRRFKPPKVAFDKYKSAEVHTKQTYRFNYIWALLAIVLIFFGYNAFNAYGIVTEHVGKEEGDPVLQTEKQPPEATRFSAAPLAASAPVLHQSADSYSDEAFIPRNLNRPESAPAYDHLRTVTEMPQIAGCVASRTKCTCYTQQGTPIELLADEYCRKTAENPEFNPYATPASPAPGQSPVAASTFVPPPAGAI